MASPTPASRRSPRTGSSDKRMVWISGLLLLGALLLGIVLVAAFGDPGTPEMATVGEDGQELPVAEIIPKPNSGKAPEHSGDRGGWEQLTLLGLIVTATVVGGVVIFRGGGSKAKARRQAWAAAAQAEHDGALER